MRVTRALFVLLLVLAALPRSAAAQASDVITGRVLGQDGRPVIGARVEAVSIETEITRSTLTDQNGRYMILFADGGGRYVIRITFIGLEPIVRTLVREADEELLLANVTMAPQAIQLDAITVRAQGPPPGQGQAGEQSTALTQEMLNRLPLPDLDPATLAQLAAGVVGTSLDSLSGRMGFSVAGMSDLLNQVTIDGIIQGEGGGVPEEGVRRTQITTSTFDPSRGGFAGGQVSMTTARGNNRSGGSLTYRLDNDALQFGQSATTNAFTRHNFGGSYGGPILRNKLFYNASFGLSRNVNHRFALTASDPAAAERTGVATDSIARFLNILGADLGFPTLGTGAYNQSTDDLRLQGRLDWNILQRPGSSQTLSLRVNTNVNVQDSTRIRELDLAHHGGDVERSNRQAQLSLTSRFRQSWTNTLNLSLGQNWNDALPYLEMPEGRVRVTSDFLDGTRQSSSLVFGGNRSMPTEAYNRNLQLMNDLSFLLPIGSQLHRLKLGGSLQRSRDVNRSTDNLFGTYTFASLEDFENNRPERFERSLTERRTSTGTTSAGLYVGDTWRVSQPLELTLGLRWDYSRLEQRPEYNPAVEAAFNRRTDIDPVTTAWSPRLGFNYRLNQQGQPAKALSGGVGVFAGRAPTNIFSTAVRQTGLPNAEQRLVCIGDAVPFPDWERFLSGAMDLPETCADGGLGAGDPLSSRAPNVTLIDPNQSMPTSVRFDLGYRTQLPLRLQGNFRYTHSLGLGLWGYRDINLDTSRSFMLAGENRPFFGDPAGIVDRTGAASMTTSRVDDAFGSVYDVVSDRRSSAHQLTAQVSGMLPRSTMFNLNYTLGFSRDQGSGSLMQATTAGDPNVVEWARSSNDRRHTANLMLAYPISPSFEIMALTRISSGSPFTPLVDRDINGDGTRNDRAFIFDPAATTDPAVAAGMQRLLENVPGRVQSCLQSQFGRIADRNSCRDGWTQSLDLRASIRPNLPTVERRLTISADIRNVLTGVDRAINGANDMRGWGEGQRSDPMLLQVRGFDHESNRFIYEVNEGFGQARRGPNAFRNAFSITLSGRLAVGGQPGMNNRGFGQGFGGMGGGGGGGGGFGGGERMAMIAGMGGQGGPGGGFAGMAELGALLGAGGTINVDSILGVMLANPIAPVLALRDTIAMTPEQTTAVQTIADQLTAQLERRREVLARVLPTVTTALGDLQAGRGMQNAPELMQRFQLDIQPNLEGARREQTEALSATERVLTAEQWARLPESVRNGVTVPAVAAGGQGGRGGQGGTFNAVALIDRMLVNPLPVLLELKETLRMTPEQVTGIEAVSSSLQERLNRRREELGRRFDNVQGGQQMRIFQEIQPQIEQTRREITEALTATQRILTAEQWQQVPPQIRNPFQGQQMGPGGGGQRRQGGGE